MTANMAPTYSPGSGDIHTLDILRKSSYAFIEYFHRPHIEPDDVIPDLHVQIMHKMINPDKPKAAFAVPRGHAKTTVAKLATVWHLLFTEFRFPLYVSDTVHVAAAATLDIWNYLTSPEMEDLTGELPSRVGETASSKGRIVEQASRGVYSFKMRYFPPDKPLHQRHYKTVNIIARGAGQQIRGTNMAHQRPDLLIIDDVENAESLTNEEIQRRLVTWMYGTLFKALSNSRKRIIQIGNLLSYKSTLMKHLEADDWASMRFGALKSDLTPLWPEAWSVEAIRQEYQTYADQGQLGTWYAEMMNLPYSPDASLVDLSKVTYTKVPDPADTRIQAAFITIDPAISKGDQADQCAIIANLVLDSGIILHAEVHAAKGMRFDDIYRKALELASKWKSNLVCIENVAFQAVLLDVFKLMCLSDGNDHMVFLPVNVGQDAKLARLTAWAGMLHSGYVHLPTGDTKIAGQLGRFDRTNKHNDDDIIDACSQVTRVMNTYSRQVFNSRVAGEIQTKPVLLHQGSLI